MNTALYNELQKALGIISADWKMQNNVDDKNSNFIYKVHTVDEVIRLSNENGVEPEYALHRWYNHETSDECERLFAKYGAVRERDRTNKYIDFYINDVSFDLKLTVYPAKLGDHPYDITNRNGKNAMIKWLYAHQSQEGRKHFANRIFIVCDGGSPDVNLRLKSDFEQIERKISIFMDYVRSHGFNSVDLLDNKVLYTVKSDLITVLKE